VSGRKTTLTHLGTQLRTGGSAYWLGNESTTLFVTHDVMKAPMIAA
jgi:hypothetical protein